jgi:hypothetical protein
VADVVELWTPVVFREVVVWMLVVGVRVMVLMVDFVGDDVSEMVDSTVVVSLLEISTLVEEIDVSVVVTVSVVTLSVVTLSVVTSVDTRVAPNVDGSIVMPSRTQ